MTGHPMIASMGLPISQLGMAERIHEHWSFAIGPDLVVQVATLSVTCRGAVGKLELEELALEADIDQIRHL